jgi:hypothetical protein
VLPSNFLSKLTINGRLAWTVSTRPFAVSLIVVVVVVIQVRRTPLGRFFLLAFTRSAVDVGAVLRAVVRFLVDLCR